MDPPLLEFGAVRGDTRDMTPSEPARSRIAQSVAVASFALALLAQLSCSVRGASAERTPGAPMPEVARPNIVLIVVDDLGQQDTSVPMLGACQCTACATQCLALDGMCRAPVGRTPNVERLAARGIRFSNAYAAAPVCTPSRTAILTGQSPARTHITYWTLAKDRDTSSRHPRLDPPRWAVNGAQPTGAELPSLLAHGGYRTIHVGKAHFGAAGTPGADPRNFGFDVGIAGHAAGAPGSFLGTDHFKDAARKQRGRVAPADAEPSVWDVPGLARWHGEDIWLDDALAREACEALAQAVEAKQPFFLNFCPYGVHTPIMEDPRFSADYPDRDPVERAYATMIAAVDEAVGRIVARCEALGVLDETVFIFTSDNGALSAHGRGAAREGARAHTHNAPLRSGKGSAYEGGLRVPLVVAGPGVPHEESPRTTPVVGTDLYPTILALAGQAPPSGRAIDGIDLSGSWRGGSPPAQRAILFHQPHKWGPEGPGIEPFSAVREGDWKLIWFHDDGVADPEVRLPRVELYDVARDPGETSDRSLAEPFITRELAARLDALLREAGAQPSVVRATGQPTTLD
jgi:arylsulfatase A-like enzyme